MGVETSRLPVAVAAIPRAAVAGSATRSERHTRGGIGGGHRRRRCATGGRVEPGRAGV